MTTSLLSIPKPIIRMNNQNPEQSAAMLWYGGLSFQQKEWLDLHYQLPIGPSEYAILVAYRNRDETRKHPTWPAEIFRSVG